jgi:hypothetical protein
MRHQQPGTTARPFAVRAAARARGSWRRAVPVAVGLALLAASGSSGGDAPNGASGPTDPANGATDVSPEEPAVAPDGRPLSAFTGLPIDPAVADQPLLVVKIENSPASRPQSGLDAADVVVEEVVEGGVTRFFVLFHGDLPPVAGPVRSARPVDTQLLQGLGPSGFAFSGARAEVQSLLSGVPSVRITEGSPGFFRDPARNAPHNLYIEPVDTLAAVVARGGRPLTTLGWAFDDAVPPGELACAAGATACTDPGASIEIEMSAAYRSGWTYDAAAGVYRRLQNGRAFAVTGPGAIGAANVVVLATRHFTGASGYPETDVITQDAAAIVLRDGRRYAARWSKPTPGDPLVLLTPDGAPFPLKPGRTWVHLPPASVVSALTP